MSGPRSSSQLTGNCLCCRDVSSQHASWSFHFISDSVILRYPLRCKQMEKRPYPREPDSIQHSCTKTKTWACESRACVVPLERVEASTAPTFALHKLWLYVYVYTYTYTYTYAYAYTCTCTCKYVYIYNTRIQKSPKPNLSLATLLDRIEKRFFV